MGRRIAVFGARMLEQNCILPFFLGATTGFVHQVVGTSPGTVSNIPIARSLSSSSFTCFSRLPGYGTFRGFSTMGSTVLSMMNFALMDLCLPNLVNTSGYASLTLFDSSSSLVSCVRLAMWMTSSAIPVCNDSKGFELACFWASTMNSALVCVFVERLLIGAANFPANAMGSDCPYLVVGRHQLYRLAAGITYFMELFFIHYVG